MAQFLHRLSTERLRVRYLPGEADIFDFEILCARWLTEQRDFQAKMGHTRGRGFSGP